MATRGNGNGDFSPKRGRGTSDSGDEREQKKSKPNPTNEIRDRALRRKHRSVVPPVTPSVTPSITPTVTPYITPPVFLSVEPSITPPVISSVEETPTSVTASVEATPTSSTARVLDFSSLEGDMALRVSQELTNGEYSLKLTRVPSNNTRAEHVRTAAMLMSQGDILRKLGENLLSHLGMSYESEIYRSFNLLQ